MNAIRRTLKSLALLALITPLAGFVVVAQITPKLQQLQRDQAESYANMLASVGAFAPILQTYPPSLPRIFAHDMNQLPLIDGYPDDWPSTTDTQTLSAAVNGTHLFLLIPREKLLSTSQSILFDDAHLLELSLDGLHNASDQLLQKLARIEYSDEHIEIRVPISYAQETFALIDGTTQDKRYIVAANSRWQEIANSMAQPSSTHQFAITDATGFILAASPPAEQVSGYSGLFAKLYHRFGDDPKPAAISLKVGSNIRDFLDSAKPADFYTMQGAGVLISSADIAQHNRVRGQLVILDTDISASLIAGNTVISWLVVAILCSIIAILPLVWFADRLSRRISALSRAVDLSEDDATPLRPLSRSNDELGVLAAAFESRSRDLFAKNRYLAQLARILGHEIKTPIAIIQGSLEHLKRSDHDQQAIYIERASEGLARLDNSVNAMISANRLEASLDQYPLQPMPIEDYFKNLGSNYQSLYGTDVLAVSIELAPSDQALIAPELIPQALDKLLSNAFRFSTRNPVKLSVFIRSTPFASHLVISITNIGPILTQSSDQLIEFGASSASSDASQHMGLGLYITDIIARHHHGEFHIENRIEMDGVTATLELPIK